MASISVTPNPAVKGTTVDVDGSGFDPKVKFALTTVDVNGEEVGQTTNTNRPRRDGTFKVGINVPTLAGASKVRAYQGTTKVAEVAVTVTEPVTVPPPTTGFGLHIGVVCVQNETTAGRNRLGTSGPGVFGGHHVHGFAANNVAPSNVGYFLGQMGSIPKMLYAALGPKELSTTDPWVDPDHNRLVDTPQVQTFADQVISYLKANTTITHVNFWNEMKGYNWGDNEVDRQRFFSHYITFASRVKAALPAIKVGGPYTTGGLSDTVRATIHNEFADNVVKVRPDLVDFIAWDHSGGTNHKWYTDLYDAKGITLPHIDTEWYPGGWNATTIISVGQYARDLMGMAMNPRMFLVMHWSGGSDGTMKTKLWDTSGNPTNYFKAMNTVAAFTSVGGVKSVGTDKWTNSAGKTLTISGDTITVV